MLTVADYVDEANTIYIKELNYNTIDYLNSHSITGMHLVHYTNDTYTDWVNIGDVSVNCRSKEYIIDHLSKEYAELVRDGKLEDDTVPDEYLKE